MAKSCTKTSQFTQQRNSMIVAIPIGPPSKAHQSIETAPVGCGCQIRHEDVIHKFAPIGAVDSTWGLHCDLGDRCSPLGQESKLVTGVKEQRVADTRHKRGNIVREIWMREIGDGIGFPASPLLVVALATLRCPACRFAPARMWPSALNRLYD